MTELPNGWATAVLGEVAEWSSGGTPRAGTAAYYGGDIPWAVIGDLNDGRVSLTASTITPLGLQNSSAKIVDKGTVLVAMYGSIGKLGISQIPMATNQAIACAVPCGAITRDWLFWWLRSQRHELLAAGKGGTQSNISQTVLKAWPIPIAPRSEQERIVTAIEEAFSKLDAGEAGLRTVRQLLERMREAILTAAVTGRLVPQDPTDAPAAKLLADLGVDSISEPEGEVVPDGWSWALLGSVSAISGGIQKQPKRNPVRNRAPFLRVANVGRGKLDLSDVHEIEVFDGELDRYGLVAGDLLVVEGNGSPDQIGRSALWRGEIAPCVHQNHLIRVRPGLALEPSYLELNWNSPAAAQRVQSVASSTSGLHTLSTGKLKILPVVVPPLKEQKRIVAEVERQLSFVEACERAVDVGLARAAGLRRSVLKAAFEGRLVPQDPSDEPASVLLDRVRELRVALGPRIARRDRRHTPSVESEV